MDPDHIPRKGLRKLFHVSTILKNVSVVGMNAIVVSLLMIALQIILSRKLGPSSYGELTALLAANAAIILVVAGVGFVVTRFIAYYHTREQYDKMQYLAQWAFVRFFILGMIIFFIIIWFRESLAQFMNVPSSYIALFAVLAWIAFLLPIIEGILRGLQQFSAMGKYKTLDTLLKLIFCGVIALIGFGIIPILIGFAGASLVTIILSAYVLRAIYIAKPYQIHTQELYAFAIPVLLGCIALAVLVHGDIILVKHFFDAHSAGQFAAAGLLAKICFGLAFGTVSVVFPKVVELQSNGKPTAQTVRDSLKIFAVPATIVTVLIAAFPLLFSQLIFGSSYIIGAELTIYAVAMLFLSVGAILLCYEFALRRFSGVIVTLIAAALLVYWITIEHTTLESVTWILFTIHCAFMLIMVYRNRTVFMKGIEWK